MELKETKYRLALIQLPGIGALMAKLLTEYFGSAEKVFLAQKSELQLIPGIGRSMLITLSNKSLIESVLKRSEIEIEFMVKSNIKVLHYDHDDYPQNLKNCDDGPYFIFQKGALDLNNYKLLGVVGTRKMTRYGADICARIIEELKEVNVLVVSGLAYGIDTIAHQSSIQNKIPTIGVLGHGLDRIYPYRNRSLSEEMLKDGGLLTEFFSGTNPDRENFPKRNRIVSGMCDGILVIEAAIKGGALITANIAHSYGREVMAVPGRSIDTFSSGCNYLIKTQKAQLVESGEDVMNLMNWQSSIFNPLPAQPKLFYQSNKYEKEILDLLTLEGKVNKEKLALHFEISIQKISTVLFEMELNGLITALPANNFQLRA